MNRILLVYSPRSFVAQDAVSRLSSAMRVTASNWNSISGTTWWSSIPPARQAWNRDYSGEGPFLKSVRATASATAASSLRPTFSHRAARAPPRSAGHGREHQ
jgi:hypothetical protein